MRYQKKKSQSGPVFFFWQGNLNVISQSELAKEAPEQSLCCTQNFAVVIFFLADAAFSKLVAGRTLRKLVDVDKYGGPLRGFPSGQ